MNELLASLQTFVRRDAGALRGRARFSPTNDYARELVHRADGAELWLLSWLPGQVTPIHDHGGAASACTVLAGALLEQRFVRRGSGVVLAETTRHLPDHHVVIDADAIHRVRPLVPTISLHLYIPGALDGETFAEVA
jgi:cysteine dioxygenase